MEKQLDVLDKYLKLYNDKKYRNTFYNFTYSEMIQHLIDYNIYDYDEIINNYKQEISIIEKIEMKEKLFPLILFIGKDFYHELYKAGFFNDLKEFLLKEFKEINFDINLSTIDKDSYIYEHQSSIKKELEKFDFNTILEFGFSNPSMGNYQYARFMYFIADKMFFEEYCKILSNKDRFNFLYLTNSLEWDSDNIDIRDKKKRVQLLKYITKNNKIVLELRLLRDLLLYEYDEELVEKIILNLSKNKIIWKQFSNYFVSNPSRYEKLFSTLGKLLNELEKEYIDILIDSIKIDNFFNKDSKEALNSLILNINDDKIKKYIIKKLFYRWIEFIDNYSKYFGSIILTDIIDIVIMYIRDFLDKTLVISSINQILYNLDEIENFWFKDRLEQTNYFYKQMSKLFVYSFVLDKYKLDNIKEKISIICNNNQILKKEKVYQAKTTLQLFKEHII